MLDQAQGTSVKERQLIDIGGKPVMQRSFVKKLAKPLPVLFVYIGWSEHYDGRERVFGTHGFLRQNENERSSEDEAFVMQDDGHFQCGIGRGKVPAINAHVIFVAKPTSSSRLLAVGIYADAELSNDGNWGNARATDVHLFSLKERRAIPEWEGQGMRRWAARRGAGSGTEHPKLRLFFEKKLHTSAGSNSILDNVATDDEEAQQFHEGEPRYRFVLHRTRERKARLAKLRAAIKKGPLRCEVPKCGFDFSEKYGQLGHEYAQVHHIIPLKDAPQNGWQVKPSDLAIVCANCHVMIHRGGECRPLSGLIVAK